MVAEVTRLVRLFKSSAQDVNYKSIPMHQQLSTDEVIVLDKVQSNGKILVVYLPKKIDHGGHWVQGVQ